MGNALLVTPRHVVNTVSKKFGVSHPNLELKNVFFAPSKIGGFEKHVFCTLQNYANLYVFMHELIYVYFYHFKHVNAQQPQKHCFAQSHKFSY